MKSHEIKVRVDPETFTWITGQGQKLGRNRSQIIRDHVEEAMRRARYRHKARGSVVSVLGSFSMQAASPVKEGDLVVAYVHTDENSKWVRPMAEFYDGRFEKV